MLGDERIKCSGDGRFSCRYDNNGDSHKDFTMTTRENKRFTAACAAMTGLIPVLERGNHDYYLGVRSPQEVASEAIVFADALLAKLEETAPPVAEDEKCGHTGWSGRMTDLRAKLEIPNPDICVTCGVKKSFREKSASLYCAKCLYESFASRPEVLCDVFIEKAKLESVARAAKQHVDVHGDSTWTVTEIVNALAALESAK